MITIIVPKALTITVDINIWKDNFYKSHKMISMIESFFLNLDIQERATKVFYSVDSFSNSNEESLFYSMVQHYFLQVYGEFIRA